MSVFVIFLLMFFCAWFYFPDKPSEEEIKEIIINLEYHSDNPVNLHIRNLLLNNFIISNNFISSKNSSYCVLVNYNLYCTWNNMNTKQVNEKYSFERKGIKWYGRKGWGPGEQK